MSNRSSSFLKRFKTQKTQRSHIVGWKNIKRTPTNHIQHTSRSPIPRESFHKIQLKQKDNYLIKCVNHPLKKALFETKQSLKQAYCQDCSIKLVKKNIRMLRISQQSLYIRALFEAEIDRLITYEEQVKQLIQKYFEVQRQAIRIGLLSVRQTTDKIINLPNFKYARLDSQYFTKKLKQLVGTINFKKIQFIHKETQYPKQKSSNQINPTKQIDIDLFETFINKQNINFQNMIQTKANNAYCEGNLRRISSLVTEKSACLK